MKVVFRVDASIAIGTGHVMRCLTLAEQMRKNGFKVEFICRKHKGNLINKLKQKEYTVYELGCLTEDKTSNKILCSKLLGVSQKNDAKECVEILRQNKADLLIVDHYNIDKCWQNYLKDSCEKLMVIDDLANRKHNCDILLDQTFDRKIVEYNDFTLSSCRFLFGAQYALIRPEFKYWRKYSIERRKSKRLKRIFVSMGGVDNNNYTKKVISELGGINFRECIEIIVVMRSSSPHLQEVLHTAKEIKHRIKIMIDASNIAEMMARSDIAIGTGGTTTWERLCLGLPTIQIVSVSNQKKITERLESVGAVKILSNVSQLKPSIDYLFEYYYKISLISSSIVDGNGPSRVFRCINSKDISLNNYNLKPLELEDSGFLYKLQTLKARRFFIDTSVPGLQEHSDWVNKHIISPTSQIFIVRLCESYAGMIKLDNINTDVVSISVIVSPEFMRKGVANYAISSVIKILSHKDFLSIIHHDNISSLRLFSSLGFIEQKKYNDKYNFYYKKSNKSTH